MEPCYCIELIDSWDLKEADRQQFKDELAFELQLCPNITSLQVEGGLLGLTHLRMVVEMTDEGT